MKRTTLCCLLLTCGLSNQVFAGAADYVYNPIVKQGERELDVTYGHLAGTSAQRAQVGTLTVGYGVNEFWFTEAGLKKEQAGGANVTIAEFENKFQFFETGKYAVDVGLITELEIPVSGIAPWELKLGPLLQTEFQQWQLNGNLLFRHPFDPQHKTGATYSTTLDYQLQLKYRMQDTLEIGAQALGDLGKWNQWDARNQQNHRIGPAVFGRIKFANHHALKYNAAWLRGTGSAVPHHTFRMQLEYEF
jgi:hypothetical protein